MALLNREGEETRIVGGAVRNALLGSAGRRHRSRDHGAARGRHGPGETRQAAHHPDRARAWHRHGARRRLPFEVTTLREDVETDGRHAVVRFGRDFGRDAERRDFTVNALSAGPDGTLHDTTGGVADLAAGRIRFIGDAETRIREDYLRILRFFRFHATYGVGSLDASGLAAAVACRAGLDGLSRERVRAETLKLLAAPGTTAVLETLQRHGFLAQILGGPGDVDRMARLADLGPPPDPAPDPVLRLHALAVRDGADVERLREGLKLSNAERDRMAAALAVLASDALSGGDAPAPGAVRALLFDRGRDAARDALRLAAAAVAEASAAGGWAAALAAAEGAVPAMPYSGKDVVARGLKGPAVGQALARFRAAYRDAGFPEEAAAREALLDGSLAP